MDREHAVAVADIQDRVRKFYADKVSFRVYHGSTNSTRVLTFKRNEMVDVSNMNRVLSIDKAKRTALVEPNVPMDKLIKATLKHGLVPPVVTEFPGITVGGAIQGAAAESSSFKYGCFSQTVNYMEIILGDGELVKASPKQNPDLFYGTAGSYGSLGLITAAEVKLIPAKKYVTITNYYARSFNELLQTMNKEMGAGHDFIEGYMFNKNQGVVIVGKMSDDIDGSLCRFSRPHDPWYYLYIKKLTENQRKETITMPLKDYLFRFNRGAFWAAETVFNHYNFPFNPFTRFAFDPLLRTRRLYKAIQESAASQEWICQDLVLPEKTLVKFLEFIDKDLGLYPIGICPMMPEPRSPLQCNGINTDLVFNVGVYGLWVDSYKKFVEVNRQIELKTHELGGKKWFYAHSYYPKDEFWQIYDKKWYDKLRKKYHATTLPDIYERTRVKEKHTVDIKRGAYRTLLGRAKLRIVD